MLSNMRIFLTRPIPDEGINMLREKFRHFNMNHDDRALQKRELLQAIRGTDGILSLLTISIDAEVMDAAGPQLKVISNYAVGYDNIDVQAATERNIMVTNTPDVLTNAVAEFTWALLLSLTRRIPESEDFTRKGKYEQWGAKLFLGSELSGRTLGIIGAGRIGSAFARRSIGWNMNILYHDQFRNESLEQEMNAKYVDLNTLLANSDFISLHVPLIPSTHHLINSDTLHKMKRTAYLVNTSRGPVIDETALVQALKEGTIAGAALDVFEHEPEIHPELVQLKNVVLTPHIASATNETRAKMATMAATNIIEALLGKRPPNLVNQEVWERLELEDRVVVGA